MSTQGRLAKYLAVHRLRGLQKYFMERPTDVSASARSDPEFIPPQQRRMRTLKPVAHKVIVDVARTPDRTKHSLASPEASWSLLKGAGFLFVLVSGLDIALAWYPVGFGNPEWEFGTITATFQGLPVLVLGLVLLLASGVARGQRRLVRSVSIGMTLVAIVLIAIAALYALTAPIALQASPPGSLLSVGLKKAIFRTAGQAVLYPAVLIVLAVAAWRHIGRQQSPSSTAAAGHP